ncbi:CD63 antigen-like, partial [Asbolus verrucosus]
MSCGELLLKSASSTFTGYFLIISIAFILYGLSSTYYLLKTNSVDTLENEFVSVPSLCLIVFGILLLVFIIVGCCAICREIPCCLEAYAICLAILASAQIGLGIFCLLRFQMNNPEFEQRIENDVSKMFWDYDDDPRQMDSTQQW